jgi:hypothetical protein
MRVNSNSSDTHICRKIACGKKNEELFSRPITLYSSSPLTILTTWSTRLHYVIHATRVKFLLILTLNSLPAHVDCRLSSPHCLHQAVHCVALKVLWGSCGYVIFHVWGVVRQMMYIPSETQTRLESETTPQQSSGFSSVCVLSPFTALLKCWTVGGGGDGDCWTVGEVVTGTTFRADDHVSMSGCAA